MSGARSLADGFPSLARLPVARKIHWGRWLTTAVIVLLAKWQLSDNAVEKASINAGA